MAILRLRSTQVLRAASSLEESTPKNRVIFRMKYLQSSV